MNTTMLWQIPLQTLAIYSVVLVGLRLLGKRQLGQMNTIDLVLLLLIANAVQNAMTGGDNTLMGGILSAVTLLAANLVLSYARAKLPFVNRAVEGQATDLILHGQILTANLAQEELTRDELLAALREHGIEDVHSVAHAALEVDGSISVVPVNSANLRGRRHAVRFIRSQR